MMWERLTPAARRAIGIASGGEKQQSHWYIGDEKVILGLLGEQTSHASSLLRAHVLDLPGARAELQRMAAAGLTPRSHTDDAGALRAVGIDVETVRQRLVTTFGANAVGEAVWRASRRPWWRGGGRRRTPLCGPPFFAKRALQLAAHHADRRGEAAVTPEHLLYGVLRDLDDPYGTPLGRRGRKHPTQLGWTIGTVNPADALLRAHGIDPVGLRTQLERTS